MTQRQYRQYLRRLQPEGNPPHCAACGYVVERREDIRALERVGDALLCGDCAAERRGEPALAVPCFCGQPAREHHHPGRRRYNPEITTPLCLTHHRQVTDPGERYPGHYSDPAWRLAYLAEGNAATHRAMLRYEDWLIGQTPSGDYGWSESSR